MSTHSLTLDVKTLLYSELQIGNITKKLSTSPSKQETDKAIAKGIELVMYWVNIRTPYIRESIVKAMQVSMNNWGNEFNSYDVMCNPQMYPINIVENALMLVFKEIKKLAKELRGQLRVVDKGLNVYMKEYQRTNGVVIGAKLYDIIFKTLKELPKEVISLFDLNVLLDLLQEETQATYNDSNRQVQIHMIMQNLYTITTNIKMVV